MRVLITGSRGWTDYDRMFTLLRALGQNDTLVHGGARGADRMAADIWTSLDRHTICYRPNWESEGKAAGFNRNLRMLDTMTRDNGVVIAFRSAGKSNGTDHVINQARKRGLRLTVIHERQR